MLCQLSPSDSIEDAHPVTWDGGDPWRLRLRVTADEQSQSWHMLGDFHRGEETLALIEPALILDDGLLLLHDRLARFEPPGAAPWIHVLRNNPDLHAPYTDRDGLVEALWNSPSLPDIEMPDELRWAEEAVEPQPKLRVFGGTQWHSRGNLYACALFRYGDREIAAGALESGLVDGANRRVIRRDTEAEQTYLRRLIDFNLTPNDHRWDSEQQADYKLASERLPEIVQSLLDEGWLVEAEGNLIRKPGAVKLSVTSNIDWFELAGECDFDGIKASLPDLLEAVRQGQKYVRLGDGSQGMLPEDWLARYAALAEMGVAEEDKLRFSPSQGALLDALLAAQPNVELDVGFRDFRKKLQAFDGVKPKSPPRGFQGKLRDYQEEGLGWLNFLRQFRFGGCLADDMGLGKTVQVLGLLESRRLRRMPKGESRRPQWSLCPAAWCSTGLTKRPALHPGCASWTIPGLTGPRRWSVWTITTC